jgi:hypothetical protein
VGREDGALGAPLRFAKDWGWGGCETRPFALVNGWVAKGSKELRAVLDIVSGDEQRVV